MKIGVFTTLFRNKTLEDTLKLIAPLGVSMVEIGSGGYPGNDHANPDVLLNDGKALADFNALINEYKVEISALSCHCNPLHPNKEIAKEADETLRKTILLAEKLGLSNINTFSGCPGDCPTAKYPNWVTCAWPEDFAQILDYQWNECLIPYWKEMSQFAKNHGVTKIGFELHPGFMLYNTETLLRLRNAVGETMGANLDPSHLVWQGMDPVAVIRELSDAIFHFHAKDTAIDPINTSVNGVLDTKSLADVKNRSWLFRTVGYGNDTIFWKNIISELKKQGYDYAISIEHEDALMSDFEGLSKAVSTLKDVVIETNPTEAFWA